MWDFKVCPKNCLVYLLSQKGEVRVSSSLSLGSESYLYRFFKNMCVYWKLRGHGFFLGSRVASGFWVVDFQTNTKTEMYVPQNKTPTRSLQLPRQNQSSMRWRNTEGPCQVGDGRGSARAPLVCSCCSRVEALPPLEVFVATRSRWDTQHDLHTSP